MKLTRKISFKSRQEFQQGVLLNSFDNLAPSDLALTVLSDTSIKLDWTNNSLNAEGVSIERSTDGISYTEIDTVTASTATYTNIELTDGIQYYYRVKAYKTTFYSPASTAANTYTWLKATLTAIGTGVGVSRLRIIVSETQTFTLSGTAKFYTDAGGTLDESSTWEAVSGGIVSIYLKCPSGTANLIIPKPQHFISWGDTSIDGWDSATNAARITIAVNKLALTHIRISGTSLLNGAMPSGMTNLYLEGTSIAWTYSGALPSGLTLIRLNCTQISWTYSGALPSGLTNLYLRRDSINWTYSGALPSGLVSMLFWGENIAWTYSGALPSGITNTLYLNGGLIDWTYNQIPVNSSFSTFSLANFRISKISSDDLLILLNSMINTTGNFPATVTINDYADYTSPPAEVIDAVAAFKLAKSVTTVNLGA